MTKKTTTRQAQPQPVDGPVTKDAKPPVITHLTPEERATIGKTARAKTPRESHAVWTAPSDRPDPIALLEEQARTRVADLVPIRYGRMLASPFAFYRGAAVIMAADLSATPQSGIHAQLCGDAHLANFGGFASPERDLVFDINDFDETLPGPWEWDVKRLAASVEIAGRARAFSDKDRRLSVLAVAAEYRRAMREFAAMGNLAIWYARLDLASVRQRWGGETRPQELARLDLRVAEAHTKDNMRALEKLTRRVDGQLQIVSSPPLVVRLEELLPAEEHRRIEDIVRDFIRSYRQTLLVDRRHLVEAYRYVDIARKVVGVGSVGTRTWIILLVGRDETDPLFLQIKEAQASVLEPYAGRSKYAKHGERVVNGQRLIQAAPDILLGWDHIQLGDDLPQDYYVRQLWDWKVSAMIETMTPRVMVFYARMCAWSLARAHARSGDPIAIAAYLGKNETFDRAIAEFSVAYANQNERDHAALVAAVKSGRIKAETGV
ncbi:MAG TPA: DUF2252 domain-containing protein [Ktedonobacterales bacterium]